MSKVFYCKKCLFPNTRPHLKFNQQGICSACRGVTNKKKYDWDAAREGFKTLCAIAKSKKAEYDCVIPVSGGKDSIYQVVKARQYGMNVLAVNVDYGIKTDEGIHNLNIISDKLGTDILTFKPGNYHKKLIKLGFLEYGDPDAFSHALLYSYPINTAEDIGIPIVLFGENPAVEYLGNNRRSLSTISWSWWFSYVVRWEVWNDLLTKYAKDLGTNSKQYTISNHNYKKVSFLGNYFYWDSKKHAKIAESLGFKKPEQVPGTYRNWVGIDEVIHRVHQYMKVIKFGYGRATDHVCEDIREGKISRNDAIALASWDNEGLPNSIVLQFCSYINISIEQFNSVVDKFRNRDFWKYDNKEKEWCLDRDFNVYKES